MPHSNTQTLPTDNSQWPTFAADNKPSTLTAIYEDNVNIAIWERSQQQILDIYAQEWIKQHPSHTPRIVVSVDKTAEQLDALLPDLNYKHEFQQDVALLVDMFACLFDATEIGLRLTPLKNAMCPRFHVDHLPCRLVTTYGGLGSEWLLEDNIDRSRLGKGANGLPDHESGIFQDKHAIQQLNSQHVALLKGSGWEGNENYGLVHRSPSLSCEQSRLLLTLDFA